MGKTLKFTGKIDLDPEPPDGVQVYFMNDKGQPCKANQAYMFTWEGAEKWHKIKKPDPVE